MFAWRFLVRCLVWRYLFCDLIIALYRFCIHMFERCLCVFCVVSSCGWFPMVLFYRKDYPLC